MTMSPVVVPEPLLETTCGQTSLAPYARAWMAPADIAEIIHAGTEVLALAFIFLVYFYVVH